MAYAGKTTAPPLSGTWQLPMLLTTLPLDSQTYQMAAESHIQDSPKTIRVLPGV
jgi:hypothetical protein